MRKEQVFAEADFFLIEPLRHLHKEKYKWPPIESPAFIVHHQSSHADARPQASVSANG